MVCRNLKFFTISNQSNYVSFYKWIRLMLKMHFTTGETALQKFNTVFLRDPDKLNEFNRALSNEFQGSKDLLKKEETDTENNWKRIREVLASTCQEVLGLKKHHYKECISIKTLGRIQGRMNKKTPINNG